MNRQHRTFVRKWLKILNALDLIGISVIIIIAFILQFYLHELPCPLCLLQRLGLIAIGFGFLLNLHYHPRSEHYGLSLLAAVFTAFVSLRQICLHILPGSGSYGNAFLGFHLYTWMFIVSFIAIIYITVMLSISPQYSRLSRSEDVEEPKTGFEKTLAHFAFVLFFGITLANVLNIYAECGLRECPDNPIGYFHHLTIL